MVIYPKHPAPCRWPSQCPQPGEGIEERHVIVRGLSQTGTDSPIIHAIRSVRDHGYRESKPDVPACGTPPRAFDGDVELVAALEHLSPEIRRCRKCWP